MRLTLGLETAPEVYKRGTAQSAHPGQEVQETEHSSSHLYLYMPRPTYKTSSYDLIKHRQKGITHLH